MKAEYNVLASQGDQVFQNELEFTSEADSDSFWWVFKSPPVPFYRQGQNI